MSSVTFCGCGLSVVALVFLRLRRSRSCVSMKRGRPGSSPPPAAPTSSSFGEPSSSVVSSVLSYWFDGDVTVNYKERWFVASGSARQVELDRDISVRFGLLVESAERGDLDAWRGAPESCLALLLLLDQFSRHLCRQRESGDAGLAERQRVNDVTALGVATAFIANGWHDGLDTPRLIFLLMVLRHSPTTDRLQTVIAEVERRVGRDEKHSKLLAQFKRTSMQRLEILGQRCVSSGQAEGEAEDTVPPSSSSSSSSSASTLALAPAAVGGKAATPSELVNQYADILEERMFEADEGALLAEPLCRAVASFLEEMHLATGGKGGADGADGADGGGGGAASSSAAAATTAGAGRGGGPSRVVAVSLSGGVDSMVLAKILTVLRPRFGLTHVVAVHIDYANRAESGREAGFVEAWCVAHGVLFRKRTINEVTRGITRRDDYEKLARDARYKTYAAVLEEFACPAIMFGHHQGDLQENVISNAMRGSSLLELAGMARASTVNDVRVWRPLLAFSKGPILELGRKYGVPWLLDSTPDWSTRGKLRSKLVPLLVDMYGDGFLNNLSALAHESTGLQSLVHMNLLQPFWSDMVRCCGSGVCVRVDCSSYAEQPVVFWKEALRHIFHSMGIPMIRDKPLRTQFVRRLRHGLGLTDGIDENGKRHSSEPNGWLQMKKTTKIYIHQGVLYIFWDSFFAASVRGGGGAKKGSNKEKVDHRQRKKEAKRAKLEGGKVVVQGEAEGEHPYGGQTAAAAGSVGTTAAAVPAAVPAAPAVITGAVAAGVGGVVSALTDGTPMRVGTVVNNGPPGWTVSSEWVLSPHSPTTTTTTTTTTSATSATSTTSATSATVTLDAVASGSFSYAIPVYRPAAEGPELVVHATARPGPLEELHKTLTEALPVVVPVVRKKGLNGASRVAEVVRVRLTFTPSLATIAKCDHFTRQMTAGGTHTQ